MGPLFYTFTLTFDHDMITVKKNLGFALRFALIINTVVEFMTHPVHVGTKLARARLILLCTVILVVARGDSVVESMTSSMK